MSQQATVLITLIVYKLVLVGIGLWAARRIDTEADFFLGGRGVGGLISGFSYAASTSSAWVLLGFSGFVYAVGLSALWMVPGIWIGYAVVWLWIGPGLQAETKAAGHVTLTDYLTHNLPGTIKKIIAIVSTFLILLCFIFYIAAQFDAAAKALVDQFSLSLMESVLVGAGVIVFYCLLGGYWAVSVTDTLQGIVMALVALVLPIVALVTAGGPAELMSTLSVNAPSGYLSLTGERPVMLFVGFLIGLFSISLGTYGQPHLLSRLMAVKDDQARRRGFLIAIFWAIAVYTGMAILALCGRALTAGALANGEMVFYHMAEAVLPAVLAGIVIAAILSAVMSTVDSILLAAAAAVAHDLGLNAAHPRRALLVSRSVMILIAVLAVVLTLNLPDSIFDRVLFAWSALGAAFGPVVFARVMGRRPSGVMILWAIISGFSICVFFYLGGVLNLAQADGIAAFWRDLSTLPGDPFERIVPWLLPLVLVFFGSQTKTLMEKTR